MLQSHKSTSMAIQRLQKKIQATFPRKLTFSTQLQKYEVTTITLRARQDWNGLQLKWDTEDFKYDLTFI